MLSDFLNKITSYNLFNYLLPGVVFCYLSDSFLSTSFVVNDLFVGAFVYYFTGLLVSRVGSLVLEPALRKIRIISFEPYADFVKASSLDKKIDVLMEAANMYRSLAAVFLGLLLVAAYKRLEEACSFISDHQAFFISSLALLLLSVAYAKQLNYVCSRVRQVRDQDS